MKAYLHALRAPFLAGSLTPVILGCAYAFTQSSFYFYYAILTGAGIAALHLGANLLNDFYDARGSDPINVRLTPFSGGSRVIQEQEIKPARIFILAALFIVIGLIIGIWLTLSGRPWVALIGTLGLAIGWTYSAPPIQLMSRGWGEVGIFFAFGPLVTLGTYYVLSGAFDFTAFVLGIPQGCFITAVIWINQFPDYEADRNAGKKNLVVRLGPRISRYVYMAVMLLPFGFTPFMVGMSHISYLSIASFIALPLAIKAIRILWREYLSHEGIVPAQALTIQTLIVHGLILSSGLFLGKIISI